MTAAEKAADEDTGAAARARAAALAPKLRKTYASLPRFLLSREASCMRCRARWHACSAPPRD
jgi:hypothetical protein